MQDRKALSVGGTINEAFSLYGSNAGVLLPIAFWLFLVVAIVNGIAESNAFLLLLSSAVSIAAGTLYQGTVVNLVRDVQDGRRDFSAGDLLSQASPFILPLIGAGILAGLGIAIGFFLLVIPGLILLTIWAVIAPVIVVEKSGVLASFGRSRELVRGNGWGVFGVIVIAFLIVFVASIVFVLIAAAIADGPLMRIVFSALAATLTAPISALVGAVLYFNLRAIEGTAAPAAPAAPADPFVDAGGGSEPPQPPAPPTA